MGAPGSLENGVLFGTDGELYLAHGGHAVLDIVTGRQQIDPAMFSIFEQNILDRARASKAVNATYLHIIFPDKQSVVRAHFPFPDPVCLGMLYQERCPATAPHTLNLTDILRLQTQPVFKRTDTHVNDYGLAVAASVIVEALGIGPENKILDKLLERSTKSVVLPGDLGSKLEPKVSCEETYIVTDWPVRFYSNGITLGNDGLADIYISPQSIYPTRVLWFGDSFGRGCVRLLSLFFREIVFLRTRYMHEEILTSIKPDVMITQNAERYLDIIRPDEEAPVFLLYPFLKQVPYVPSLDFTTAMSALLSYPRSPYRQFIRNVPAR